MDMDVDQAKKLLEENGMEFSYDSSEEALRLAPEEFAANEEFMKKAIGEDPKTIIYDKTNSDEVYIQYLDSVKKEMLISKENDAQGIYSESIDSSIENIDRMIRQHFKTKRR